MAVAVAVALCCRKSVFWKKEKKDKNVNVNKRDMQQSGTDKDNSPNDNLL